ncbi:MAG: hypothetical protein OEY11_03615 [Gammaproteobacteria bacterium]|nr:hypothetical protein [Gammaproteobacteria bacterium]
MSTYSRNYHSYIYSTIVFFGIIICFSSVYFSISKINYFEHNTNRIHRLITSSEIELGTLEKEIKVIESTVNDIKTELDASPKNKKKKNLTKDFVSLRENIFNLRSDIAEKQKLLISLNLLKSSTLSQIKTLFWINSGLLIIGSLMVLLGALALILKLEIFEDRRKKQRAGENEEKNSLSIKQAESNTD